jgi:pimeloyl-ACP methyl ester carboxylesterase
MCRMSGRRSHIFSGAFAGVKGPIRTIRRRSSRVYVHGEKASIYYDAVGEGRPIVILHALAFDHQSMKAWLEPVFGRTKGWCRIYVDMPGMGRSKAGPGLQSGDDMLEAMLEFVDAVLPGETFALAAMSYGSLMARGILHERRDRVSGLMLLTPPLNEREGGRRTPPRTVVESEEGEWLESLPEDEGAAFRTLAVRQTREMWERFAAEIVPGRSLCDRAFLTGPFRERRYPLSADVDHPAQPYKMPALIVTGKQDAVCGYEGPREVLLPAFPNATFAVLDGAGHLAAMERTTLFQALAADWLDRLEQAWDGDSGGAGG